VSYSREGDEILEGCAKLLERMASETYHDMEGYAAKTAFLEGAKRIRAMKNKQAEGLAVDEREIRVATLLELKKRMEEAQSGSYELIKMLQEYGCVWPYSQDAQGKP